MSPCTLSPFPLSHCTLLLRLLAPAALLALPLTGLRAEGGGGPVPAPAPPAVPAANLATGSRLFDESVRWVAKGAQGIQTVTDFYVGLEAKFDLEGSKHEGPMRLWLQLPDLYRQEMTMSNTSTTKVLARGNLYVRGQDGTFKHMNRTPDGALAVVQSTDDMERLKDLTTFLTLEGLKGPGVTFEFEGEKQPRGDYERPDGGTWAKVVRKAPGKANITFWLAHTRDATGTIRATYPGVVRVDGEPQSTPPIPTEDYLLHDWRESPAGQPRPFLYPRSIRAFQLNPGQQPFMFLKAFVNDIKINAGIDATRFEAR